MFSNSTKYAIRSIVHMLQNGGEGKFTVVQLAQALDIPQPFLSKIMQQLSKSKIISSTKGRGGGFYLNEKDMLRPLMDLIVCIEGENIFKNCILGLSECSDKNPCILHSHFGPFREAVCKDICNGSVKDLLKNPLLYKNI
jgi:Rrf2 family iron-sulfur cluster assembly transcriptional regulator